nr:3'(2'),5'-bisphosphate nucleotidase 1-like [Procambarus clarkii]XP_045616282.1 3'(2'),5'-bisphosphate nucleotidase 1-like [Procambarus clarkii]XP_045616283.1 3'(2'),5'-bisphosphate nucleotidase 1-like [Procambarus clarkii]XP_045616284.1 3'(2'),5'-bisphosphate nucleotidase 1-like [Procambarus clarkii]XP_045616285.1 3'(2'),5'-bisphosphate nucleotidase 1-like [Procambarus clarkii]XP_045616287.1 3'(2'),5'-bisphosphate nucleotidase 1-like [Procambarus clarkii]XP_045616288.1 3'(2'),5'-bisphospha
MSLASQSSPLLSKIVSSSVVFANHAGKIIRDIMKKGELGIVQKESARDLQTEADRAAQRCIIGSLARCFPKLTIIGEEGEEDLQDLGQQSFDPTTEATEQVLCPPHLASLSEEEIVVWVDPLDGTAEYTQGLLDHVTVLIGFASAGKAVGGVIHQPYYNYQNPGSELGRTIWGIVGGEVCGMPLVSPPDGRLIVTTTRSHSSSTVNDAIDAVSPDEVLRVGGAGHKVMLLLEGKAHVYVFASPGCKKWDTCAPQAILEAAGGTLTDIKGALIPYHSTAPHRNSTGVLASAPGQKHEVFLAKIPQHVKDNLKA